MTEVKYFRILLFILILAAGCSSSDKNKSEVAVIGTHYTTVVFDKGKFALSRDNKDQLKKLTSKAHKDNREIDEIRILAWADEEYPDPDKKVAPNNEIVLASNRAHQIEEYLEDELQEYEEIDSYNMARRPDFLSKLLRDDEFEVKEAFETSGATATKLADGNVSYSKASKALVIIDYEGDEDNLK